MDNKSVTDSVTELQWAKKISSRKMDWQEARRYYSQQKLERADDWRLPSNEELNSTIHESLKDNNPKSNERPFHGPFIVEKDEYLFSGTPVQGQNETHHLMRLDNGLIFKAKGEKAYVRCVRDKRFN